MTTIDGARSGPALVRSEVEPEERKPDGPRQRRRVILWGTLGAVVVAVGSVLWWLTADSSEDDALSADGPVATATVELGTISATESWDGTLDRGTPIGVRSSVGGTVTRIVEQGATVGRGDVLFWIDEQPVTLLAGVVPMYRDLATGASGADVQQLETNLAELGYVGFTVDDQFTTSTAEAVEAWQEALGATPTGIVGRGAIVFAREGGQVNTLRTAVGSVVAPGTAILDVTGSDQVVELQVEMDDLDRFTLRAPMTVVLPDGSEVAGAVDSTLVVGVAPADPMAEDASTESIVQVEVALAENTSDQLVGATVEVVAAVEERTDVLLVPVTALLALAEGGYGLEVVDDDGTTLIVPVETGLFASGKVEVISADITEGTVVGVAGR